MTRWTNHQLNQTKTKQTKNKKKNKKSKKGKNYMKNQLDFCRYTISFLLNLFLFYRWRTHKTSGQLREFATRWPFSHATSSMEYKWGKYCVSISVYSAIFCVFLFRAWNISDVERVMWRTHWHGMGERGRRMEHGQQLFNNSFEQNYPF